MIEIEQLLNKTKTKKLLVIFPHPDDETVMAGGLMQLAIELGYQVKVICVTNGVLGRIHIHGQGRSVVQIRRQELQISMDHLGVTDISMWRFCDGLLAQFTIWQEEVNELLYEFKPGLVISYGPCGVSGHPDHLTLGEYIFKYWKQHNNFDLIWPTFSGYVKDQLKAKSPTYKRLLFPQFQYQLSEQQIRSKKNALLSHESQKLDGPIDWLEQDPTEYFAHPVITKEYDFSLVDFDLGL